MNFGEVLEELRKGKRACREGWNGKNMWIYIERGKTIPFDLLREPQRSWLGSDMKVKDHFNLKNAQGDIVVGWLASQEDMLADDWGVVGK